MSNPLAILATCIASLIIYPIAIIILKYQPVLSMGVYGVLIIGVLFSCIPIFLWWLSSKLILTNTFYKLKDSNQKTIYNEYLNSWKHNITIGSFSATIYEILFLVICYLLSWEFKVFILLTCFAPIIRIILFFITRNMKIVKKAKDGLSDDF